MTQASLPWSKRTWETDQCRLIAGTYESNPSRPSLPFIAPRLLWGRQGAHKHGWPRMVGDRNVPHLKAGGALGFTAGNCVSVLNIAGARASEDRGIYDFVKATLEDAFFPKQSVWIGGPGEG